MKNINFLLKQITDKFLEKIHGSVLNDHVSDLNLSNTQVTSNGLSNLRWDHLEYVGFAGLNLEGINIKSKMFLKPNY